MRDGELDFSKYTAEQIERSLRNINREKYPLNYANLLAAQRDLPDLPMDAASIAAREHARLLENVSSGRVWISAPALFTFWLPCLSRIGEWHLAVIELRHGARIKLLPRSREVMRAFAAHVGIVQGGVDVADPKYQSIFSIGCSDS